MFDYDKDISYYEEQISDTFDIVKRSLAAAHMLSKVEVQTSEIRKSLESLDYEFCYSAAQKFLKTHKKLINRYSGITGICVISLSTDETQSKDIAHWKLCLRFVEMIIYVDEALKFGVKIVIEKHIKEKFN